MGVYLISCRLIQIAHLFARILQREVVFGPLGLFLGLAPRLESTLEQIVWGEHLRPPIGGRHSKRLSLLLLLIEVFSFAQNDALHTASGHPS